MKVYNLFLLGVCIFPIFSRKKTNGCSELKSHLKTDMATTRNSVKLIVYNELSIKNWLNVACKAIIWLNSLEV